jgi:hypothetical protein
MKSLFITLCIALSLCLSAIAQQAETAKDLYYRGRTDQRSRNGQRRAGRPGTMVKIELKRDSKLSYVTPSTTFRNGDRVRLHIQVNRSSYLTVLNEATSGMLQLIYPRRPSDSRTPVSPTLDFTIPAQEGKWLEFDNNPGTERLHIVLSAQPVREVSDYLAAIYSGSGSRANLPTSVSQERTIEDALNSKAFRGILEDSSKDFTEVGEAPTADGQPAVFVVSTTANTSLKKPVAYKLLLRHVQ